MAKLYRRQHRDTLPLCPGKDNVFILSDFNNWEFSDEGFMYKDGDRFWKEVGGLIPQKEYIYQYRVDDEILIADLYADKLLDPWNDKYISSSTYPGLIPYPSTKTDQIASVLQTAQTPYNWSNTAYSRPAKTDLVIYKLLLRDFVATHDYQTLIDTLSYLKRVGVNAIELMPVSEFEGNSSWGYITAFNFAPDKYYGTKNDLKEFIERVVKYWITEYKVDGYRFDLSKGFTQNNTLGNTTTWGYYDASRIAIWMNIANKIWATDPGAYIILEHFADNTEEKVLTNYGMMLWGNMNYKYRQSVSGKGDNDLSWGSYKNRG